MSVSSGQGTYSILVEVKGAVEAQRQFKSLGDSVAQMDSRFKTSSLAIQQVGQNIQRMGQQVQTSNAPLQQLGTGMTNVQVKSQQLVGTQGALGNAFRTTGSNIQGSLGSLTQYNTLLGNTGTQTTTLRQRLGELGSSFAGVAGSMTAVVGSGVLLFQTLGSLVQAQRALDQSNLQVQFRQQRTMVRQAHVNRLIAQGKENTETYTLAVSQLALTQERERQTLLRNEDAQARYNIELVNFAGQVLPAVTIAGGSLVSMITTLTAKNAEGVTGISRLSDAFRNLISAGALGGVAPAIRGAISAFDGMTSSIGGVTGAITITTAAFVAIVGAIKTFESTQNLVDGWAAKVEGDLEMVDKKFQELVHTWDNVTITPPSEVFDFLKLFGIEVSANEKEVRESLDRTTTNWNNMLADIQGSENTLLQSFGNIGVLISGAFERLPTTLEEIWNDITTQTGDSIVAIQQAFSGIWQHIQPQADLIWNTLGMPDLIEKATDLGGQIVKALQDSIAGKAVNEIVSPTTAAEEPTTSTEEVEGLVQTIGGLWVPVLQKSKQAQEENTKATEGAIEALEEEKTVITELEKANQALNDKIVLLSDSANLQTYTFELLKQGVLKAQDQLMKMGEEVTSNSAFLQEWGRIIETDTFHSLAFEKGIQNQVAALQKSKVEVLENVGVLAEYEAQIESGAQHQIAFAQGQQTAQKALLDNKVALSETAGVLDVYSQQIQSLEAQQIAFTEGIQQQDMALLQSIEGLARNMGQLQEYNAQLEEGAIQSIAFAEGQMEVLNTMAQLTEAQANLEGQMLAYNAAIQSGELAQKSFNLGIREGGVEVQKWFASLTQGEGQLVATVRGLESLAAHFRIELPRGVKTSTDAMKNWIALMLGAPSAIAEVDRALTEMAQGFVDNLGKAWDEGKKEFKDFIKGIEEEMDLNLPKSVEKVLRIEGKIEDNRDEVAAQLDNYTNFIGIAMDGRFGELGEKATQDFQEEILDEINQKIEEAPEQMRPSLERVKTLFEELFKLDPNTAEFDKKVEEIKQAIVSTEPVFNSATSSLDIFKSSLDISEEETKFSDSIDNILQKMKDLSASKLGPGVNPRALDILSETQLLGEIESLEFSGDEEGAAALRKQLEDSGGIGGGQDMSGAQQEIQSTEQMLQNLQQLMISTVDRIRIEVAKVPEIFTTAFNTATQNAAGVLGMLVTHTATTMTQVADAATHVEVMWPAAFTRAVDGINTPLATMQTNAANAFNAVVNLANITLAQGITNAFFAAIDQVATGPLATIQTHAANSFNAIVSIANETIITGIPNAFFGAVDQVAVGPLAVLQTHSSNAFTAVVNLANEIIPGMVAVFENAVDQINSALDSVITHAEAVQTAVGGIGDMALEAANSVDQLKASIDALEDRTITITTNYETTGTPPASGAGGIGYHDGQTYLPLAGGTGTGGLGFAPIVIDHPTNLLVGESGPELVSVTPINRNRNGRSGEMSPFANLRMAGGSSDQMVGNGQGFGGTINLQNGNVIFEANQGPITVNQGSGSIGNAGIPTTESGGFTNNNVGLGTGQGGIFNVPGGQGAISGNATVCINGQCFGNTQGLGAPIGSVDQQQQTQGFKPIFDDQGMIKAIETLSEWFKFLGLPTGASVPGTGSFTPGTEGTITGKGAFSQSGAGLANISMQGGQIVFDANQGDMELQTSTGAISIAGQGGAFARAGNAIAQAGVGLFGNDQNTEQLTQLNRTMNEVSGSLQAVGNSMASLGDEVVFGNQQLQQTLQTGPGENLSGGQPVVFQGTGQTGFQSFPGGGAVGAGGAAGDPLGFLSQTFGQLGLQLPAGIPSSGGTVSPGTGLGGGGISTGGTGCNTCSAASGLGNAATDLSGAAGQLGNAIGQMPTGGMGGTTGIPTTNGGFPTGGGMGTPNTGTQPGTGSGCSCSCMPMDSDPNRYKIEDPSGNDCNNHIYFDSVEECHSRLNEICPGENTNNPTPTNPTPNVPTTPPQNPTGGQGMFLPGVSVSGPGAVACVNGQCFGSNGLIGGGQQQVPGVGQQPIGNPPVPPQIVQQAGLPSQASDVNQDPASWTIVESAGAVGTYDIIDDSGDVVQLGFRTLRDAETYLNYFVSYYEWVESGSTGIPGPVPVGGGTIGGTSTGGIGTGGGITAGSGGVMASAGGGGAFAQAGNAIAQAGNFLGNALGFGSGKGIEKKIGSVPVLESIPRAQGPFRSGQDNQEPIYDNSRPDIIGDSGTPLDPFATDTTSQDEHEYGKSPRFKSRIQRHLNTAIAIAGDRPEWVDAFLSAFERMFGDLVINLAVNNNIDGYQISQSQKKYQVKKVSVYN